jgi:hypothetical protein
MRSPGGSVGGETASMPSNGGGKSIGRAMWLR